ncbi:membrane dipeptidase [Elioraea sp.]|uniref:membrane dipeptidase n=1 Tax=Elioraea sp. TaxID=2185103 RepID=UPI003F6EE954
MAGGAPLDLVIDGACPLARDPAELRRYRAGGVTVCMPTVGGREDAGATLATLARMHRALRTRDDLRLVRGPADVRAAQRSGRLGLLLHLQGGDPFGRDAGLVEGFRALGVRMVQLCYNVRNRIGDGCAEPSDAGLSTFGVAVVRALNEAGMIVDCAHTGERTARDAMAVSRGPVVCSHANPRAVHPSPRNIGDELIRAIADSGGLIGMVGFPAFVSASPRPGIDAFIDHVAHVADLVGVRHVALGLDYFAGQDGIAAPEEAERLYRSLVSSGDWDAATYPPPPWRYPEGIETPERLRALGPALARRGFAPDEVGAIMGGNWLRVIDAVLSDDAAA